ncbi:hypothetical protein NUSPORA_01753 [Nucleospora cyclopteri]
MKSSFKSEKCVQIPNDHLNCSLLKVPQNITKYDLDVEKVSEIKDMLRVIKKFTDREPDSEIRKVQPTFEEHNELENGVNPDCINNEILSFNSDSFYEGRMYFGNILNTKEHVQICSLSFVYNQNVKGKSNSVVFFTNDFKYCIKTIRKNEFNKLEKEIKNITEYLKENPKSFLARYYGVFSITYFSDYFDEEQYFVIMKNVFSEKCRFIYDLKGTDVSRKENEGIKMVLSDRELEVFAVQKDQMIRDAEFLCAMDVMDYSMIIGRNSEKDKINFSVGIVDTLTEYTFIKKMERLFNIVFCDPNSSSTNPQAYFIRFRSMIDKYFQIKTKRE